MTGIRATHRAVRVDDPDGAVVDRIERLLDRLERLSNSDLARVALPRMDEGRRREVEDAVARAARESGRGQELRIARAIAAEAALRRFGSGTYRPTWVGLNWGQSLGRVDDRVAVARAFGDAAAAAAVGDVVPGDVAEDLWSGVEQIESVATPGPPEESLELALSARRRTVRVIAAFLIFGWIGQVATAADPFFGWIGLLVAIGLTLVAGEIIDRRTESRVQRSGSPDAPTADVDPGRRRD